MLYKYTVFPYNSFHAIAQEDELPAQVPISLLGTTDLGNRAWAQISQWPAPPSTHRKAPLPSSCLLVALQVPYSDRRYFLLGTLLWSQGVPKVFACRCFGFQVGGYEDGIFLFDSTASDNLL